MKRKKVIVISLMLSCFQVAHSQTWMNRFSPNQLKTLYAKWRAKNQPNSFFSTKPAIQNQQAVKRSTGLYVKPEELEELKKEFIARTQQRSATPQTIEKIKSFMDSTVLANPAALNPQGKKEVVLEKKENVPQSFYEAFDAFIQNKKAQAKQEVQNINRYQQPENSLPQTQKRYFSTITDQAKQGAQWKSPASTTSTISQAALSEDRGITSQGQQRRIISCVVGPLGETEPIDEEEFIKKYFTDSGTEQIMKEGINDDYKGVYMDGPFTHVEKEEELSRVRSKRELRDFLTAKNKKDWLKSLEASWQKRARHYLNELITLNIARNIEGKFNQDQWSKLQRLIVSLERMRNDRFTQIADNLEFRETGILIARVTAQTFDGVHMMLRYARALEKKVEFYDVIETARQKDENLEQALKKIREIVEKTTSYYSNGTIMFYEPPRGSEYPTQYYLYKPDIYKVHALFLEPYNVLDSAGEEGIKLYKILRKSFRPDQLLQIAKTASWKNYAKIIMMK